MMPKCRRDKMQEKQFKTWTPKDVEEFCENNWIEDSEWLEKFVCGEEVEAHIEMDTSSNPEGDLVVVIKGKGD